MTIIKRKQELIYGSIFDICCVCIMIMVKHPIFEYVWLKTKSNISATKYITIQQWTQIENKCF